MYTHNLFLSKLIWFLQIINWSSLDYLKTELRHRWELDSILGTTFDICVHLCMAYFLGQYLSIVQVFLSLALVQAGVLVVLFGPYYAWANPGNIPPWIQKRIHPDKVKDVKIYWSPVA